MILFGCVTLLSSARTLISSSLFGLGSLLKGRAGEH